MENVNAIMQEIANGGGVIQTYAAKVIAINKEENLGEENPIEAYTVNVVRSDGAQINNVRLKASIQDKEQGVICIPKLNSWVFISIIETTETRAFISQYSEIEKIFLRIKNENGTKFFEVHSDVNCMNLRFNEDDKIFEIKSDVNATNLFFKKEVEETNSEGEKETSYKNITSLEFNGEQKELAVKFWDEEGEKIPHQTTIAHNKVSTQFIDTENDELFQETIIDANEVSVKFEKGYEFLTTKEKTNIKNEEKDIELDMESKFLITAGGENLKKELDSFIDEVSKIVVLQGTSPNVGVLNTIKENIGKILK